MPGLFGHWYLILIILAIALIVFGPARLPELGSGLGKAIREFRKGASEMTENLKDEVTKPPESASPAAGTTYPPVASVAPVEPPVPPVAPAAAPPMAPVAAPSAPPPAEPGAAKS